MFLEAQPLSQRREAFTFGHAIGLPVTLEELGLPGVSDNALWEVAEKATAPGETIHKARRHVTAEEVFQAILAADTYGREIAQTAPRVAYS